VSWGLPTNMELLLRPPSMFEEKREGGAAPLIHFWIRHWVVAALAGWLPPLALAQPRVPRCPKYFHIPKGERKVPCHNLRCRDAQSTFTFWKGKGRCSRTIHWRGKEGVVGLCTGSWSLGMGGGSRRPSGARQRRLSRGAEDGGHVGEVEAAGSGTFPEVAAC
jgi:hypothetical protein